MRGDLEDGIGARVDDGPAGGEMLAHQFLDDDRAARRLVAEKPRHARELLPFAHQLRREAVRERREPLLEYYADHFPVAGRRIFSLRQLRHRAEARARRRDLRATGDLRQVAEPPAVQRRELESSDPLRRIAERIRAAVAVGADGLLIEVHHEPDKALSDGMQSLLPEEFIALADEMRQIAAVLHRTIN